MLSLVFQGMLHHHPPAIIYSSCNWATKPMYRKQVYWLQHSRTWVSYILVQVYPLKWFSWTGSYQLMRFQSFENVAHRMNMASERVDLLLCLLFQGKCTRDLDKSANMREKSSTAPVGNVPLFRPYLHIHWHEADYHHLRCILNHARIRLLTE